MFTVSESWRGAYPEGVVGILAMRHLANPEHTSALERQKEQLENLLRSRFSNYDRRTLKALPVIDVYNGYYKRFKKTYHVLLQLESVVIKGKSIPRALPLVEAMFMAELKNQLLTAGHDREALQPPVTIDVAEGSERYVRINGQEQQLKPGDMMIADSQGIISSVVYGPDQRSRITSETRRAFFTVYGPPGIANETVHEHLQDIKEYVLLVAPKAEVELLKVYCAE